MLAHLHVTLADLSSGYQECRDRLRVPELQRTARKRFADLCQSFRPETISYCVDGFIFSELDTRSKERKGVGRMSDLVPRFAGVYGEQLLRLPQRTLQAIGEMIKDVVVCGYVQKTMLLSEDCTPLYASGEELYDVWMPQIYLVDDPIAQLALRDSCSKRIETVMAFMEENGLPTQRDDDCFRIIAYYGLAGSMLRQCEVTPWKELPNPIPGAPLGVDRLPHPRDLPLGIRLQSLETEDSNLKTMIVRAQKMMEAGEYARAENILNSLVAEGEHTDHTTDEISAELGMMAGAACYQQGKYRLAEDYLRKSLACLKTNHGPDDYRVAVVEGSLADVLVGQSRFNDAEPLLKHSLAVLRKTAGEFNPVTLTALGNLASLHGARGEYDEAKNLAHLVWVRRQTTLGAHHPDSAQSLCVLSEICNARGEYSEAEQYAEEGMASFKKSKGENHPDYAVLLNNLGAAQIGQGKHARAERALRQSLGIIEQNLGLQHPCLTTTLSNLSAACHAAGKQKEAEALARRAAEIERKHGDERS